MSSPIFYAQFPYSDYGNHRAMAVDQATRQIGLMISEKTDHREWSITRWEEDGIIENDPFQTRAIRMYAMMTLVKDKDAEVGEFVRYESIAYKNEIEVAIAYPNTAPLTVRPLSEDTFGFVNVKVHVFRRVEFYKKGKSWFTWERIK
jgi:hypothetical protein